MLVLSRKKLESIVINDDITIVVVEIRGDKVRLGVEAPKNVPVHRREVFDALRRNEAVGQKKDDDAVKEGEQSSGTATEEVVESSDSGSPPSPDVNGHAA